ncbi:ENTH domain-containing protein [Neofusicoccum parvum]|uniref:ENTH domain-containing protein n=1 Tax=Neofusicoccum parvum TaxID=310453 RepID=A0ACB5RPU9_9PEZI|nr:ENTH domain-containing protein [Neofusicoccum parvum]GME46705.1 ENTH domain-containing protein [Neofusicoccum parvum]
MDIDSLKDKVSNLTLYDLKAGVRKVQNAVMNYTEMEAKVREATNNEPWGASSSLMQEIANGTYNYQLLNEIMPMIYKRFTEKSAEEWRQIYKALQLLEFLIKNGSERVIDDARSHLSLLKMLRQFHYIDMNGKDQGINVRNRAKELGELLSDVERIRSERKKARATRNKYTGVEGGAGLGGGFSSSSRYGGFGSETGGAGNGGYGGFSGGVYGDGGGFGGESDSGYHGSGSRRERFDEYDEYDEGAVAAPSRRQADTQRAGVRRETSGGVSSKKKEEPPKPKEPEVDLFSFDDPEPTPSASNGKAPAAADDFGALQSGGAADDDDFDDFQSATPAPAAAPAPAAGGFGVLAPPSSASSAQPTQFAAPQPRSGAQASNINDLFSSINSPAPSTSSARHTPSLSSTSAFSPPPLAQPSGYAPSQPNYFTSVPIAPALATNQTGGSSGTPGVLSPTGSIGGVAKKPAGGDAFSGLLSGMATKKNSQPQSKVTMADLAKQKTTTGLWGAPAAQSSPAPAAGGSQQKTGSSGLDDLLG